MNDRAVLHDIIEASAAGCPLCQRRDAAERRFVKSFAYELVNDPGMRVHLRGSLGFCRIHAEEFAAQVGAPLAVSLIHSDLCGHVVERLETNHPIRAMRPCPACEIGGQRERHDLELLGGSAVPNLCATHPAPVPKRGLPTGPSVAGALPVGSLGHSVRTDRQEVKLQGRAYSAMRRRLEAVVHHYDYRFRDDPFDDFGATWQALALFSGTHPDRRPSP